MEYFKTYVKNNKRKIINILGLFTCFFIIETSIFSSTNFNKENLVENEETLIDFDGNDKFAYLSVDDKAIVKISDNDEINFPLEIAKNLSKKLNTLYSENNLIANDILPGVKGGNFIIHINNEIILTIDNRFASNITDKTMITLKLTNNLRKSFGAEPLDYKKFTAKGGIASWYGDYFQGKSTSSGEKFNKDYFTAAHRTLPLGSIVLVKNIENNKSVLVKINDRGPFADTEKRVIDLSQKAFNTISSLDNGTAKISINIINLDS